MADAETPAPKPKVGSAKGVTYAELEKKVEQQQAQQAQVKAAKQKASAAGKSGVADGAPVAPKKMGFDPLRPFRYMASFARGTVGGTLTGISKGGRIGLLTGLAAGAIGVVGFGLSAPMMLFAMPLALALGGIAAGGGLGLVTGGVRGVLRTEHREEYADTLVAKPKARSPNLHRALFNDFKEEKRDISNVNFDRTLQENRENAMDERTYWENRMGNSSGFGRGF